MSAEKSELQLSTSSIDLLDPFTVRDYNCSCMLVLLPVHSLLHDIESKQGRRVEGESRLL
jgi:hypothetical protein